MPAFKNLDQNPYNYLLYNSIKELGVEVDEYNFSRLLIKKYDIWHLHWPEIPLNHKNIAKALIKIKSLLLQIDWAKARGTKIVWTTHNLSSHERLYPKLQPWFWQEFTQRIDGYISLSKTGMDLAQKYFPNLKNLPGFVIPHNHYRGEYPNYVSQEEARATLGITSNAKVLLFFGRIRNYKNVPKLVETFQQLSDRDVLLYIAGRSEVPGLKEELVRASESDSRLRIDLNFIAKEKAQLYFKAADLVVLPYSEILNSGTALLSLSFARPVLVPLRGAMGDLKAMVSSEWVFTYEGNLVSSQIEAALAQALNIPREKEPVLNEFDLQKLALQTADAYREIVNR